MTQWLLRGLRAGVKTGDWPDAPERATGVTPGMPHARHLPGHEDLTRCCPTGALYRQDDHVLVDRRRCVHCMRCARGDDPMPWDGDFEWAQVTATGRQLPRALERSVHVRVVDAGDCGACLREVRQLNNPYYNMHRLGFFFTPTPRQADVLLVVGCGTEQMRDALRKTYEAMPGPKVVIAAGACALSGGIFGPSYMCAAGAGDVLPVDIEVPGNPPPPLAVLHALMLAAGRVRSFA